MKYYSKEVQKADYIQKTAGVKARDDVEAILKEEGYKELKISTIVDDRKKTGKAKKLLAHFQVRSAWIKETKMIGKGDILFVQYPTIEHSIFLSSVFRDLRKRGAKIYFLIHDLEYIRLAVAGNENMTKAKSKRLELEQRALRFGNKLIVHNSAMLEKMIELGFDRRKLVNLEIFDYLMPDETVERFSERRNRRNMPVIIAGNLSKEKAEYLGKLPEDTEFNLFGVNYTEDENDNHHYQGEFMPDELPYKLDGSFGLVWDGSSSETCEGVYGKYLRINNPHKTSLYLASGIPVIIWSEAALAGFVKNNKAGITVDSLYDIEKAIGQITDTEYEELKKNVEKLSEKLRSGYYTRKAIKKCEPGRR